MKWQKIGLIIILAVLLVATAISSIVEAACAEPINEVMSAEEFREATLSYTSSIPASAYGGEYLDEAGNLVINIKEGSFIPPITGVDAVSRERIMIQTVKYSLAELEAMKDALVPYMLDYDIASLDANEVTTTIDIELWEERDDIYSLIESLEVIDMDIVRLTVLENVCIEFTMAEHPPAQIPEEFLTSSWDALEDASEHNESRAMVTIYPGTRIAFRNSSVSYGTAGPKQASGSFYSAGHLVTGVSLTPDVYDHNNSQKVGKVTSRTLGANGDKCTISILGGAALPSTNALPNCNGRYTISSGYRVGETVEMWGASSGIQSGTVQATNQTVTISGTTVSGLVYATYSCKHGDSGAGIFSANASTDTSAKCYGIQSCGRFATGSETAYASYFSPF